MSLINQMLKDIEARQRGTRPEAVAPGLRPTAAASRRASPGMLLLVGGVAAAAAGGGVWFFLSGSGTPADAAQTTVAAAPAAPARHPGARAPAAPLRRPVSASVASAVPAKPAPPTQPPAKQPAQPASARRAAPEPRPLVAPRPVAGTSGNTPAAAATPEPPDRVAPAGSTGAVPPARVASDGADRSRRAATPDAAPRIEKRARPLSPEQLAARHYQSGYALLHQGRRREAEAELRQALEAMPAHRPAREAFAALLLAEGRRVELLPVLERGLALDPGHAKLAQLAARVHLEDRNAADAAAVLERAMEHTPDLDLGATLAAIYQQIGRFEKSAEMYRRLLAVRPDEAGYWAGLGIALEAGGDQVEALTAFRKALARGRLPTSLRQYVDRRIAALGG